MTIDEAKEAVRTRTSVWYNGAEWTAAGIISWHKDQGYDRGWRNSLYLIPADGTRSVTRALVRDCSLTANGTQT